ncbi:hypothetical protein KVP08_022740 (plasmid) [Shewanella putrefaciens]|nr:hypothetical protein KVP08_022740 [Shewanella putrefaciens]
MKLFYAVLGVVAGIYISSEYPDVAVEIFNSFVNFSQWLWQAISSMIQGG